MTPSAKFAGKHAVITGAGSGIGRAIALRLAAEGAHVYILDLNADASEAVAAEVRLAGGEASAVAVDVADPESVRGRFHPRRPRSA